jgi:outer membrane biosynthesis protein TonB
MQRFFAIVGAGMLGVIALWLALVWFAPQTPTQPPVQESSRGSPADVAPKLRDVTVDPAPATVPKVDSPAAAPKNDTRAATAAPTTIPEAAPPSPPAQPQTQATPRPEPAPSPQAAPSPEMPADEETATVGTTEDEAAPARPETRFPRGSAGCTRYKTYNPQTQTYRGYDGIVRPCRPL